VLLRAAEGQDDPVVASQVGFDLHPVHVTDAHVGLSMRQGPGRMAMSL
jgi:hypothetical protein